MRAFVPTPVLVLGLVTLVLGALLAPPAATSPASPLEEPPEPVAAELDEEVAVEDLLGIPRGQAMSSCGGESFNPPSGVTCDEACADRGCNLALTLESDPPTCYCFLI